MQSQISWNKWIARQSFVNGPTYSLTVLRCSISNEIQPNTETLKLCLDTKFWINARPQFLRMVLSFEVNPGHGLS